MIHIDYFHHSDSTVDTLLHGVVTCPLAKGQWHGRAVGNLKQRYAHLGVA